MGPSVLTFVTHEGKLLHVLAPQQRIRQQPLQDRAASTSVCCHLHQRRRVEMQEVPEAEIHLVEAGLQACTQMLTAQ